MKVYVVVLLLIFGTLTCCNAQPVLKHNWKAMWITNTDSARPNSFHQYRHTFKSDRTPQSAIASIAADSKYWLYVNGKLVVFEGGLKRGPTPEDSYFDVVDITSYLQKGDNHIAILVWYWGKQGFCHNSSGKAGLLFQLESDNDTIVSNATWRSSIHPAYGNTGAPYPNFRLPEHNVLYDARLGNADWISPSYNDSHWELAIEAGAANGAPWNKLWQRPIPLWYDGGLVAYENAFAATDTGKLRMKLPKNITVTPYLKIKAPAGLKIDIRTDNYYGGSEPNIRTEYITKEGIQEFESPAYFNGHEVIYSIPAGVQLIDLRYRETKYNTVYVGGFKCNDSFFNKLWQKAANTMNVNMRDAIQDPDRERAQWWGDVVIILEEIFYSCDSNGIPAIKKAISNLLEWQRADSVLFSPIPAGNWNKELPAQMLASVGKYGIWKYVLHSGDTAMIRYAYPFVKKYMALWNLNDDGLVQHRSGGWDWHDWGEKIDVPLLDNAWYYMALEGCYNMAQQLGLHQDAAWYQKQMQTVSNAFQQKFWKGNRFASDTYEYFADDRGNGLAVCAGLASSEQWKKLKPVLDTTFHAGPYLEKYILESYFLMHDAAAGMKRMKHRYQAMVDHKEITTLWEGWEIGSATYGGGTYNHGWSGGPLSLLSGYVAGIQPTDLGYKSYSIIPQFGEVNQVSANALTPLGMLSVSTMQNSRELTMHVKTIDAAGKITVPKYQGKSGYTINGKKRHKHLRLCSADESFYYFESDRRGEYTIKVYKID